ncbi:hypothetical protein [Bacillus thuringiensis]|uniref:hypothetical protein n=1 Tax=Bacillus thuringiensis TaxID=1428 RepID=UPI0021579931|nr:hypothetical protein [Bacillus thuringiensis]MCR6855417.1 hypothetical protein [Bacillus thuringiensis]
MRYFEFNNHEYWALVAAESEEKAHQVYTEEVAGNCDECRYTSKEEGPVTEVSKEIAFGKYIGAVAHIEENQGRGFNKSSKRFSESQKHNGFNYIGISIKKLNNIFI